MAAIQCDAETGQMIRPRAIHGTAKERDYWHAEHEQVMTVVEANIDSYLCALTAWAEMVDKNTVPSLVGSYAHAHGLTFLEALYKLFRRGDADWVKTCQEFGKGNN